MKKLTIKYKLTTQDGTTHGGYKWSLPSEGSPGKWHETSGEGDLCGSGFLHAYHHPLLAVMLNPIHANIQDPILWRVEVDGVAKDDCGLKCGYSRMRLVKKLPLPVLSVEQRIVFAILCAQEVYKNDAFAEWACKWMDGSNRSAAAAAEAAWAAEEEWAAMSARSAAAAAAWAAAVSARSAAAAAAWAAEEEWAAAEARAAVRAAVRAAEINLVEIAKRAKAFRP